MKDVEIIGMLKTYIQQTLVGMGALKGAPCTVKSVEEDPGVHVITLEWTDNDGNKQTKAITVLDGTNGTDGFSPEVTVKTSTDSTYILTITTEDGSFDTPNLKGGGSGGSSSMADLEDVELVSLSAGQVLKWDAVNEKWVNASLGTAAAKDATNAVTEDSTDLLESGAAFTALADKADKSDTYTKTQTDDAIKAEIETLDVSDSAVAGSYVTAVSEADGKISVSREAADASPTENSNKMVKSGGVYTELVKKADNVTGATNGNFAGLDASGNLTDSGKKAADFATAQALADEAATRSALGAKNYLQILASGTTTTNGITFVVDDDGTITVSTDENGATADTNYYLNPASQTWVDPDYPIGDYILSGCPAGGSAGTYRLALSRQGAASVLDTGTGTTFTHASGVKTLALIQIGTGTVLTTPIVFKPMIRLATDANADYQTFAKTNKQLTDEQGYITEAQWTAINGLYT